MALATHLDPGLHSLEIHAIVFGLLTIAAQGIVSGRTVYVVSASNDSERPFCVAVVNLIAGSIGLPLALLVGSIADTRGIIIGLSVLLCLNIAAAVYARTLPDVVHKEPQARV